MMNYRLKSGVSFCQVVERTIFLDLAADRYFCLSPAGECSFTKLLTGETLSAEDRIVLDNLIVSGPLDRGSGEIVPCPSAEPPLASFLDDRRASATPGQTLFAATALVTTMLGLRFRGLRHVIDRLRKRKANVRHGAARCAPAAISAAFARLRVVATHQDNCLSRSIAVSTRLIAVGARPELVIAVKLQPFGAHAWVQCDGHLVNDRHEFVRDYTPILIV